MTRFTLHVPEQYNDGAAVDPAYFTDAVEPAILALSGGFTLTHGIGAWRGDDTVYREPVRLYAIDAEHDLGPALTAVAEGVARHLEQEAVYLTAQEIAPQLVFAGVRA